MATEDGCTESQSVREEQGGGDCPETNLVTQGHAHKVMNSDIVSMCT